MTTTQERLRLLAPVLRKQPRMIHHGVFVDELLIAAADEIQKKADMILSLGNSIKTLTAPQDELLAQIYALEWYAEVTAEQAMKTKARLERMAAIREKEL